MQSRRQSGLQRLLTHQALCSDARHRVHAHIDVAFQCWNGLSWTRVAGDASLPHYCQCCASDNEAQEAGLTILQSLADDASCKDFMASRWHKKVIPMQIWTALVMLDTDLQVAERAGNKKRNMADDFNGIVQEILSRRRTKIINWCRERSTPFIMGMKLFVLVMLEPFVLDKISSARKKRSGSANSKPPRPAAPARPLPVGQGEGVRKEQRHPIVKLKDSYVGFAGVLPSV